MSGVVRASLDVALEVLADGFSCEAALAEWMLRLSDQGLRYCPLAQEQILLSCIDQDEEEPPLVIADQVEQAVDEPSQEGSLIIPELEEEQVPDAVLIEQAKPSAPAPPAAAAPAVEIPPVVGVDLFLVTFRHFPVGDTVLIPRPGVPLSVALGVASGLVLRYPTDAIFVQQAVALPLELIISSTGTTWRQN